MMRWLVMIFGFLGALVCAQGQAASARPTTAVAVTLPAHRSLLTGGTPAVVELARRAGHATGIVAAEEVIREPQPELPFIHSGEVDAAGYGHGWDLAEQLAALERNDGDLARILATVAAANLATRSAIILWADRGGSGRTPGLIDPRSRQIPWVSTGPQLRPGDPARWVGLEGTTEDTCATACDLLGLSQLPYLGKPVLAAFENPPPF